MNNIFFQIYLFFWQKIPIKLQNRLSGWLTKISFDPNNQFPPLPKAAVIDTINICNLDCPLCPSKLQNYKKSFMSFNNYKSYLDKIPSLKVVVLFNWGEPFLNRDIFKIIKYTVSKNIYTVIHSNFSLGFGEAFFIKVVESGVHQLVISADGASQDTYQKYRVKGDFELILENMKLLVHIKNKLKKRDPKIIWKFLVNRFNESELHKAKIIAKNIGVEILFEKMGLGDDLPDFQFNNSIEERKAVWLPKNKDYISDYYKSHKNSTFFLGECNQLFQSVVINPDGKVTPCCWITDEANVWGDLNTQSIEDIWYNDNYLYSRNLFSESHYEGNIKNNICTNCNIFERKK